MAWNKDAYLPTEETAERAVELWKRLLRNPKYDNMGDTGTPSERAPNLMAAALASMIPSNATEEILEKFGRALKAKLLMTDNPWSNCLNVDYGPDRTLAEAAEEAGLKMEWPWKTVMHVNSRYVSLAAGYAAESEYHYPLGDGRWLVTKLSGTDISKVIELVKGGTPQFTVE